MDESLRVLLRPELAELQAYIPADRPGIVARLDANEAPATKRPEIRAAVAKAIAEMPLERYPDARATRLREAIALRTGARAENLLIGTGSDESISLVLNALGRPRAKQPHPVVLSPTPTFVMYRVTARAHGAKVMEVPLDATWDLDLAAMKRALEFVEPNVIFIASPNNPTGNRVTESKLREVVEIASKSFVVIDEAYVDYAGPSLRGWRDEFPRVGILRTLSKVGLAALRIGWLEADGELVREIDKGRQPFNVSAPSQVAAAAVLENAWDAVQRDVETVVSERARVEGELSKIEGFSPSKSDANFLWVRTSKPAEGIVDGLASRGVLVRSFHKAGGRMANQLRVTIGTAEENNRFLEAARGLG